MKNIKKITKKQTKKRVTRDKETLVGCQVFPGSENKFVFISKDKFQTKLSLFNKPCLEQLFGLSCV